MGQINATQWLGMIGMAAAAIACGWAARRDPAVRRSATIAALIFALAAVEVLIGARHRLLGDFVRELPAGDYALRRSWQLPIVVMLAVAAPLAIWRVVRAGSVLAGVAAALVLLFAVESVSLHALDAVFYRPAGPVLLIGWLWLALCIAAMVAARRAR